MTMYHVSLMLLLLDRHNLGVAVVLADGGFEECVLIIMITILPPVSVYTRCAISCEIN